MTEEENTNQLPKEWNWSKLGEAVQILDNLRKPINSSERQKRIAGKSENELFPYYGATGQVGWIDNFITDGEYVLVGEDGAPFLDNFKAKAYKIKGKTWVNNHAHILKEIENRSINNFILHYLNSINYSQYVNGTTRLKLTKGSLVEIPFPVPTIKTQLAIVSKIEELFSEIEKGIESLFTAKQQLKTYRQSVLKWAFEGKLTNGLNFDSYDLHDEHDLSIAAEPEVEYKTAKNQGNQKNHSNQSSDKGELPKGWKVVKLKEVCEIKRGKSKHRPRNEPALYGGKYPFIQTGDIRNSSGKYINEYSQTYSEQGLQQSKLWPKGTLCITIAANIGETAILGFDACFPDSVVGLLCDEKFLLNKYANYFFISFKQKLEELAPATAQKNINVDILERVEIPLAPIKEQHLIVQAIESRLSVADKMEESITQSLQQAEALKQSILKKAFEGKLV